MILIKSGSSLTLLHIAIVSRRPSPARLCAKKTAKTSLNHVLAVKPKLSVYATYLLDGFTISVTARMTAAVIPRLRGYTCMTVVKDGD